MDLSKMPISSEVIRMLKTQNLDSISFGPHFEHEQKRNENIKYKNDIVALIDDSLNKESKKQLKGLGVYRWNEFRRGWADKLAIQLPALESLDLSGSAIKQNEFWMICCSFHNLKALNIGESRNVYTLSGISNLKHLEVLVLRRLRLFHSHEELEDLFGLKKLRMLDISFCGPNVMEKYLKCEKVLEELQFLDCSVTDIDKSMVEKLMATHKNLKQVAVLGTIIDFSVFPGINLLNCATADSILKALDYYTKLGDRGVVLHILDHIHEDYLESFDNKKHGHLLENFLKSVCRTIEKFKEDEDICQGGIFCLVEIGKDSVIKLLQPSSRYYLINQLLEFCPKYLDSAPEIVHVSAIKILDDSSFLDHVSPLKTKMICKYAINCLVEFFPTSDEPKNELILLGKIWKKLSSADQSEICVTPGFHMYLYEYFDFAFDSTSQYFETHRKEMSFVLDVLCQMANKNLIYCAPEPLTDLYKKYPSEWAERSKFIEIMANMIRNELYETDIQKIILEEKELFMDLLDVNINGADQIFHAMTIISLVMTSSSVLHIEKEFWARINEKMMKIGRCFPIELIPLAHFEPFLGENNYILRDVLRKSKHENGGAAMWAFIIIQGILMDNEEKNKKILKNMGLFNALQGVKAKGIGKLGRKVAELLMNL